MSDEKKIWTFAQMLVKVRADTDLNEEDPDEQFVTKAQMIGFFNEAIEDAEKELLATNQDYLLSYDYLPTVVGQDTYDLPRNINMRKFRTILFNDGSTRYPIRKYKPLDKFTQIEEDQSTTGTQLPYRYFVSNVSPGQEKMILVPPARETAVISPMTPTSQYIRRWYIRNANRIPYEGEYTNPLDILPAAVDVTGNTIAVAPLVTLVTGDAVKFSVSASWTLPTPLVVGTVYYVIAISATSIKLATTAANAAAGTAIDLTVAGTGFFTMRVAATDAIIDATQIDIPDYSTFIMEWVKANCLYKDGDPRLSGTVAKIEQQRMMMQVVTAEAEPDNDDTLQGDFSAYQEMN